MKALRIVVMIGVIIFLISCASQLKPAPAEDPRVGQLQSQVDDLQKQVAAKDATNGQPQAKANDSLDRPRYGYVDRIGKAEN
jgi:hypothetical protein